MLGSSRTAWGSVILKRMQFPEATLCNHSKAKRWWVFSQPCETQCLKNLLKVVFYPFSFYQVGDQILRIRVIALHIHVIEYISFSAGNYKEKRMLQEAVVDVQPSFEFHYELI